MVGCNGANNIPELTLRIKKDYFETNLSWQTGFTLIGWGPRNGTVASHSCPSHDGPHPRSTERLDSKPV